MVLRSICGIYKPAQAHFVKKYHPWAEEEEGSGDIRRVMLCSVATYIYFVNM